MGLGIVEHKTVAADSQFTAPYPPLAATIVSDPKQLVETVGRTIHSVIFRLSESRRRNVRPLQ